MPSQETPHLPGIADSDSVWPGRNLQETMNVRCWMNCALLGALTTVGLSAELRWEAIEQKLTEHLGLEVRELTVAHAQDELLVVTEEVKHSGMDHVVEHYSCAWGGMKAKYAIVLVDTGELVPGAQHLMLKNNGQRSELRDLRVTYREFNKGRMRFEFTDARTLAPAGNRTWTARIEKIAEFAKRHPHFTPPSEKSRASAGMNGGTFVIRHPALPGPAKQSGN